MGVGVGVAVTAEEGRASTGEGCGTLGALAGLQAADLEMVTHPEEGRGHTDAFTTGLRSSEVAAKASNDGIFSVSRALGQQTAASWLEMQ